jgi:hypothetical protein
MGRSIAAVCCSALVAALLLFLAYASTATGNVYALGAFAIAFPVIAALGAFKSSVLPAFLALGLALPFALFAAALSLSASNPADVEIALAWVGLSIAVFATSWLAATFGKWRSRKIHAAASTPGA